MNCKQLCWAIVFTCLSTAVYAQAGRKITGKVTTENGKPVRGLAISIVGHAETSITNINGKYRINLPDSIVEVEFNKLNSYQIEKVNSSLEEYNLEVKKVKTSIYETPIEDLINMNMVGIEVTTVSLKAQSIDFAPSNVTVITQEVIQQRGYQSLVDVCEDIPGFDFFVYEDGGGEYPTFNMNRGLGAVGNTQILIMVDGIIQNNISFNWSLLWTYENLLADVERIEIIEGPGSSIYGAQAFSGVIHFITRKDFDGVEVKPFVGSNGTAGVDIFTGKKLGEQSNISFAFHQYHTDGDRGDRYDPGNYFHGNKQPSILTQDYNEQGDYLTNIPNPIGGQDIPDGFQNWHDSYSFRAKLKLKSFDIGAFVWQSKRGIGSYVVGYEYDLMASSSRTESSGYHINARNDLRFNDRLTLESNLVFRSTNVLPKTGFSYLYRFPGKVKSYSSFAYQTYAEERLSYVFSERADLLLGIKGTVSQKSPRVISLDYYPGNVTGTISSWDIAAAGDGLYMAQNVPVYPVNELAIYGVWNSQWSDKIATSIGIRYDNSSEFGEILNPRLSFIYKPTKEFGFKLLYGTAFKQPSIFELNSEFRGNPDLNPEKIATYELEVYSRVFDNKVRLKSNLFYSRLSDFIGTVPDPTKPSGERYSNLVKFEVAGWSVELIYRPLASISFYTNYMYLQGKDEIRGSWHQLAATAEHKVNAGVNLALLREKLNVNARLNYIGKRKAQETNTWIQTYEGGFAPSFTKMNMVISYKISKRFTPQLIMDNLFNTQFYGLGRETGNGFSDDYDHQTNPNPTGFIPAYHPQAGRSILLSLKFEL